MPITDLLKANKILLLGFGAENKQFLDWLLKVVKLDSNKIIIADQNPELPVILSQNLVILSKAKNLSNIQTYSGNNYLDSLKNPEIDYVFKAPGIWSLLPELEEFRKQKGQDRILSNLVFFFERFRNQIIAVTGTKGKSTTCNLINHFLNNSPLEGWIRRRRGGFTHSSSTNPPPPLERVLLNEENFLTSTWCGNTTNISPYTFWTKLEQKPDQNQFFVVEISSFQLQDLAYSKTSSKYGIITNYYIDHQDQHATKEEYWDAKDTIFKFQNSGDLTLVTESVILNSPSAKGWQTRSDGVVSPPNLAKTTSPDKSGTPPQEENLILISQTETKPIKNTFQINLPGEHNLMNITQALLITEAVFSKENDKKKLLQNIINKKEIYQKALDNFTPIDHRLQLIRTEKFKNLTINFYDDGAANEPNAAYQAAKALTEKEDDYLWLQIAGIDKGGDISNLIEFLKNRENQIYKLDLCGKIGEIVAANLGHSEQSEGSLTFKKTVEKSFISLSKITEEFETWLKNSPSQTKTQNNFPLIRGIRQSRGGLEGWQTKSDGVDSSLKRKRDSSTTVGMTKHTTLNILFSPCGSSFDEFSNYQERAKWWTKKVKEIKP